MINAVNAKTGKAHVTSDDVRNLNAAIVGGGNLVSTLNRGLEAEMIDGNTLRIHEGSGFFNGCFFRVEGCEDATITTGSAGYNRMDIVALKYTNENSVEGITVVTFAGAKTTGTPTAPNMPEASILAGASIAYMPLYEVVLEGINVVSVTSTFNKLSNLTDTAVTLNQKILDLEDDLSAADKTMMELIKAMPIIQAGAVAITPSAANTPTYGSVTFPEEFPGTPIVTVTPYNGAVGTTLLGWGAQNRSTTGFDAVLTRTNTTAATLHWIAVYIP